MIKRELQLSWRRCALREPSAWLIASSDTATWLDEIESWRLEGDRIVMHVMPGGAGVLVVLPDKVRPNCRPHALAYSRVGSVFLPVDAELRPAVSEAELSALVGNSIHIFHPALGLIHADAPLSLADLLFAPVPEVAFWNGAVDVPRSHPRIETIGLRTELSLDDIIQQGRDDIATEPPEGMPRPGDRGRDDALSDGWRAVQGDMLRGMRWLFNKLPGGSMPAPFDRVERWIGSRLEKLSDNLGLKRNRALSQLLDQLKSNPEEGLRHALPLGSLGAHRGVAPPSGRLGSRSTDFRLSNLAGGGPLDGWHVPPAMLAELRKRYVELAERERQMGRFRRAAYVYAELLTDLDAAAKVLSEGAFWNEAAILYRDHLNNPVQAAHCFVEARLLEEAIVIYERHALYGELVVLYRRLGQEARAVETIRRWVQSLLDRSDRLHAAEILMTYLSAREEALALLESAWPNGSDALACMRRAFTLYGEAGQHDSAHHLLHRIRTEPNHAPLQGVIELLASLQRDYPDRQLRTAAEDIGRRMVAARIEGADQNEQMLLVRLLNSLAPNDRLLARDGHRFLDQQRKTKAPPPKRAKPAEPGRTTLTKLGEMKLGSNDYRWVAAIGCGSGVAALAVRDGEVMVVLGNADERQAFHTWKVPGLLKHTSAILASDSLHPAVIFAAIPVDVRLPQWKVPAIFGWDPNLKVGHPDWCPAAPAAAAIGAAGTLWVVRLGGPDNAMLTGYSPTGIALENILLNQRLENALSVTQREDPFSLHLACPGDGLVLAIGQHLYRIGSENEPLACFDETIVSLVLPPRWAKPHVACVLSTEVQVCWLGPDGVRADRVLGELENPMACFGSDGVMVIISGETGFLADVDSRGRQRLARFEYRDAAPVAMITGFMARTFAVLDASGTLTWWKYSMEDFR
jgi:tetratricopeptide (TPR) repeat protein